jgi:hypothetical protein
MKTFIISVATSVLMMGLLIAGLIFLFDVDEQEITIQSLESRTTQDEPVFNKIKYFKNDDKDIWMMNQSHVGMTSDSSKWERLAIVIQNKKASFYQLEAGPLVWSEDLLKKQVSYRVSCFMCHNNGPRAIRPDQQGLKVSFYDQAKIFFWNLKIKSYGRIKASDEMTQADQTREIPFKHKQHFENETLNVKTCLHCHKEEGFLARGKLTRQQAGTIEFLVKNKIMPPAGFYLSEEEQNQISDFVAGF